MTELTAIEKDILVGVLGERGKILVSRNRGEARVVLTIGQRSLTGDRAHDALSALYSRGLVQQKRLNLFVLTRAGRQLARLLLGARN